MRLEIWCKIICLSADWCLCTALRSRSGASYCWLLPFISTRIYRLVRTSGQRRLTCIVVVKWWMMATMTDMSLMHQADGETAWMISVLEHALATKLIPPHCDAWTRASEHCRVIATSAAWHATQPMSYIFHGVSLAGVKLPPTLATAHYSSPDNAIGLVAQRELNEYVKSG